MYRKHISIVVAFVAAAGVAVCGAEAVFAQESTNPPQLMEVMPPPPSPSGGGEGGSTLPPMPVSGGSFEPPQMTPPSPEGEFRTPMTSGEEMRPPEMMGRPVEQRDGGDYKQEYQKEYQRQFNDEVRRETEMRTQEMQKRFAPPPRPPGGDEFRPKGQPFMDGGRDNAQGRPFMGEQMPQGRPFGGGPEGDHRPQGGSGGPEMMSDDRGFGEGGFGGMGGEGENLGPSEEEMERMAAEQEKRMRGEQLRQMKRGMGGMEQGLRQIKKMMDRLSKSGLTIPADAQALVSELSAALEKVKNATEFTEEIEVAMEVMQDKGQDLGDVGQRLGMLEQMSQMTKQVEKQFAQLDKALAKAKKRKEASQFSAVVSKVEGQISSLKQRWAEVKQGVTSGDADPEDLRDVMDGIFEEVGDAHRAIEMIRQLGSVGKMLKTANKEIATFEKQIARQRKAGKDVSRLDELLVQGKAKLAEVKAFTEQSGFEPEDLFGLMQELEGIGNEAHDELDRVSGRTEAKQLQSAVIESLKLRRMGL